VNANSPTRESSPPTIPAKQGRDCSRLDPPP
jgi:hypothetical protein